ncbi:MAG: cation transporter dimerization domain-containing protein, partial [Candidatus Korarchaeota archaeon]|nr:cation transporter dimerization domain-containing protein [Candidatus Korarchaeota archaeon]
PGLVESIREALSSAPGVRWVERVRARRVGRLVLVDAVVGVDPELTTEQASRVMMEAHRAVERIVNSPCDVTLAVRPAGESLAVKAARIAKSEAGVIGAHSIELYGPGRDRLTLHLVIDGSLRLGEADEIARRVERKIAKELSLRQVVAHIDHFVQRPRPDPDLEAVRRAVESVPSVKWARVMSVRCADGGLRLEVTVGADPFMSLAEANRLAHEVQAALAEVAPDAVAVVRVTTVDAGERSTVG